MLVRSGPAPSPGGQVIVTSGQPQQVSPTLHISTDILISHYPGPGGLGSASRVSAYTARAPEAGGGGLGQ